MEEKKVKLNIMGFELSPLSSITVFVEESLIDKLADHWDCQEEDGEDRAYYVYFEWIMAEEDLDPYEFDFLLLCNKICGASHYNMQMKIIVEEEEGFNKWLAEQPTLAEVIK